MTPREHFLVAERVRGGRRPLWKDMLYLVNPPPTNEHERRRRSTCSG